MNKIEAFVTRTCRRMVRILWTGRTSNDGVLRRLQLDRMTSLLIIVKRRKLEYVGHIMRGPKYHLLRLILNWKIEGKNGETVKIIKVKECETSDCLNAEELGLLRASQYRER